MARRYALASWIQERLDEKGWTPADLSRNATGISTGMISKWMNNTRPSPESCQRLADALGADVETVMRAAGYGVRAPVDDPTGAKADLKSKIDLVDIDRDARWSTLRMLLDGWLEEDRARGIREGLRVVN